MGKKSKSQKNKKSPSPTLKAEETNIALEPVVEETGKAQIAVAAENVNLDDEFYDAESIAPSSLNESAEQPSDSAASPLRQSSLSRTHQNEDSLEDGLTDVNQYSLLANSHSEETNNIFVENDINDDNETIEAAASEEVVERELEVINDADDTINEAEALTDGLHSLTLESNEAEPEQILDEIEEAVQIPADENVEEIVQKRQESIDDDGFDDDFDDFVEADKSAPIPIAPSIEPIDTDVVLQPISFDEIRNQASKIYAECEGERRVPMIRFEFAKSEFRKRLLAARAMEAPSL